MTTVYDRLNSVGKSPAWNRASAYVIMHGADYVGKILCKWPKDGMGALEVFLWDCSNKNHSREIQRGNARGCGYDKLAAALCGLKFADLILKDHPTDWKIQLEEAGFTLLNVL